MPRRQRRIRQLLPVHTRVDQVKPARRAHQHAGGVGIPEELRFVFQGAVSPRPSDLPQGGHAEPQAGGQVQPALPKTQ